MIVHAESSVLRLVTQSDHAHLAGAILGLWRADGMPENPRREALLFAAREHDNGWREADAAPQVDPATGQPYDFVHLPHTMRQEIWRRGTARHLEHHPYPALLILEHARALHSSQRGVAGWDELLAEWDEERSRLLADLALDAEAVRRDYRYLEIVDAIALAAAGGFERRFVRHGHRVRCRDRPKGAGIVEVEIDPFPLAGATTFSLACRRVPDRPYRSDSDLALAAATARWATLPIRLVPREAKS